MEQKNVKFNYLFILTTILVLILGGYLIFKAMHWGPWAFSDSAAYVSAARNFAGGKGFVIVNSNNSITQVTEFPPFYPFLLSMFLGENGDPNITIKWLNIVLFSVFIAVFSYILYYVTKNLVLTLIGTLSMVVFPVILETFSGVMSETLFFPLLYTILLLVLVYIKNKKTGTFTILVVLSALLPITRYAGILFVVTTAALFFFFYPDGIHIKIRRVLLYLSLSLLPIGLWFLNLYTQFEEVGGKIFKLDKALLANLLQSIKSELSVLSAWLPYHGVYENGLIDQILFWGSSTFLALLIILITRNHKKHTQTKPDLNYILFVGSSICLLAYLLFIAFTHSITVPQIDIIDRMLAPIYPMVVILLVTSLSILIRKNNKLLLAFAVLVSLIALRFYFMKATSYVDEMEANGRGYSARQYQESGIIERLQNLPENQRMISNSAAFVLYYTNRFPIQINQFSNYTYGISDGYGEKSFREKDAVLIMLYPDFSNYYGNTAGQLLATITNRLNIIYHDEVSGIYTYPTD